MKPKFGGKRKLFFKQSKIIYNYNVKYETTENSFWDIYQAAIRASGSTFFYTDKQLPSNILPGFLRFL